MKREYRKSESESEWTDDGRVCEMRQYRLKPGKSMSVLGMIVGVIFIFIGVTQVIQFGFFGVVWTLIAFAITIYHAVNVFTNKGISAYQVDVQDHDIANQSGDDEDYAAKLRQLHQLREDNIITEEEYRKKKEEILNTKW